MAQALRSPSVVVLNPASGPGDRPDDAYAEAIETCRGRGLRVLGYVHTRWWRRPMDELLADLDAYARMYPTLDGSFLDELSNDPAAAALRRLRDAQSGSMLIGNPGAPAPDDWQLRDGLLDVVVTFEGTAEDYLRFRGPGWTRRHAERCAHLVYGAQGPQTMEAVRARADGAGDVGLLYATDGVPPNPWGAWPFNA